MVAVVRWVDAETLRQVVPMSAAIDAIEAALRDGLDPTADVARSRVDVTAGELLLMPSAHDRGVGVKLAAIAPDNPSRGLPTIHATYVLFDPTTLVQRAILDGTALTALRTPAVSAVAIRRLAPEDATHLLVFGTGPQARGHVEAVLAVRPIDHVTLVARDASRTAATAKDLAQTHGIPVTPGTPSDVAAADVIVCATSATTPLFAATDVPDHACVAAIGAHHPTHRELPAALLARASTVVVEDHATALREAGDIVLAIEDGSITEADLTDLATLVRLGARPPEGPTVFKGTGMAWQDLVVATKALDTLATHHPA